MPLTDFVRLIRTRNRHAREFDALFRDHIPALYRSAYRWTGSVDRAEDLVQDLLTRLYPRLEEIRDLEQLRPWAMRVMYRIFVDQLRRERRSPVRFGLEREQDEDAEDIGFTETSSEPDALLDQTLTQERIIAAWSMLTEAQRVVLSMHDIEEYSLIEISQIMAFPIGTVKSRVHRARARLREILQAQEQPAVARLSARD